MTNISSAEFSSSDFDGEIPENIFSEDELNSAFKFDLGVRRLGNLAPGVQGKMVSVIAREHGAISINHKPGEAYQPPENVLVRDIFIEDPYVKTDRELYLKVNNWVKHLGAVMLADGGWDPSNPYRTEALAPGKYNRYTKAWLHGGEEIESRRMWRSNVPTALAIKYLQNPSVGVPISFRKDNDQIGLSKESAALLRYVDDGIAIRDRAAAMQHIAKQHVEWLGEVSGNKRLKWLSLASGTGEPAIASVSALQKHNGSNIDLTLVDNDPRALNYVDETASKYRLHRPISIVETDILQSGLAERLQVKTSEDKYDVVDAIGIFEYIPQDGDEVVSNKAARANIGVNASDFMKTVYNDLLAPDGVFMVGNMIHPRPQLDFVLNVVDWPLINIRSEESLVRILDQAGILHDPTAVIEMFRVNNASADAHVYNLIKITKTSEKAPLATYPRYRSKH